MAQLTESIINFLTGEELDRPPATAMATAIDGFTDCLGVMVAGHNEAVTRNLLSYAQSHACQGESRILLGEETAAASLATLIGTGSAHALDFDDYAYSNHVSALLVPAIIADAERLGSSGTDMLQAYLAGFEIWGLVFKREKDHLHSKGWHPTGVFGPLGVAAALCRLRRLNAQQCRNALGLAATNGAGVMDNFGSQAKPYQGARAAEAGVVCVELAMHGVGAGPDAIDGDGGMMAALSPAGNVDRQTPATQLGIDWTAARNSLNIKPHPTVGASQRAIDAAIQLQCDYAPEADQIETIIARVSEKHAAVMRLHRPQSASEARFSLEFGVAAGLIAGRVTLAELEDSFVERDDIQKLIRKVEIATGPDDDPSYPVGARFDTVEILRKDGSRLTSKPVYRFRGHGENPMDEAQLKEKFDSCTLPHIGEDQAHRLFNALRNLANLSNVFDLPTLKLETRTQKGEK